MSEKIFKNRITQETPNTIKQLKSLWIDMSSDKQLAPNTPNGLFAFTLNPNNFVDAVKLETDFKSILSHYYHWRYGSKWRKLKHISASIIREKIPSSNMSEQEIKSWLVRFPPESIGLPEHVIKEIKTLKIA